MMLEVVSCACGNPARWAARTVVLGMMLVLPCRSLSAQAIQLEWDAVPLRAALLEFAAAQHLDIVFSERQVDGRRVSCSYAGDSVAEAMACLISGHGLRAERVRRRQFVLLSGSDAPTASIRGFVSDGATGEPLPRAHVYVPRLRIGAVTNEAGYFALASLPPGNFLIRVSYVGFAPLDTTLEAGKAASRLALLAVSVQDGELVVEAERSLAEPGLLDVPVRALRTFPAFPGEPDLLQALQWLPGVRRAGSAFSGIIVRGGQPDQNLYLLDGAPVYHPWHAFSLISLFQPETFKQIRLYQGSFPAEYGGRLSAVLDAELRDGGRGESRALVAIGALSGRFIVEQPLGRGVSVMASGRRSYLDRILGTRHAVEEAGVRDTLRTGYYFYDLSGKVTWRLSERNRLSVSAYSGNDVFDVRLPFELSPDIRSWLKPASLFFEIDTHWGTSLVSARHQFLYSDRLFLTATGYVSRYRADEGIVIRPAESSSVRSDYAVDLRDAGLKLDVDYYPGLAHRVRAGLRLVARSFFSSLDAHVQRSPGSVDLSADESDVGALELVAYLQDVWQPVPGLEVRPGLRASTLRGGSLVGLAPRLGLQYTSGAVTWRASAGRHIQYLHRIRDRHSLLYDLVSTRWVAAAGAVEPSTSINISAGLERRTASGVVASADAYLHRAAGVLLPRDVFQFKDGLEGPGIEVGTLLGQYARGSARAYGLELVLRREAGPWQGWFSYGLGRSETRAPGAGYRPIRFDVPQEMRSALARSLGAWTFSFAAIWRTGLPLTVPVARYAIGSPLDEEPTRYLYRPAVNNGRLPPYLRFDVLGAYEFDWTWAHLRFQVQAYNFTNRRNVINRIYQPDDAGSVAERDRRGLPILPLFEIRATF